MKEGSAGPARGRIGPAWQRALPFGTRERAAGDGAGVACPGGGIEVPCVAPAVVEDRDAAAAVDERGPGEAAARARQRTTDQPARGEFPEPGLAVGGGRGELPAVGADVGREDGARDDP